LFEKGRSIGGSWVGVVGVRRLKGEEALGEVLGERGGYWKALWLLEIR